MKIAQNILMNNDGRPSLMGLRNGVTERFYSVRPSSPRKARHTPSVQLLAFARGHGLALRVWDEDGILHVVPFRLVNAARYRFDLAKRQNKLGMNLSEIFKGEGLNDANI